MPSYADTFGDAITKMIIFNKSNDAIHIYSPIESIRQGVDDFFFGLVVSGTFSLSSYWYLLKERPHKGIFY